MNINARVGEGGPVVGAVKEVWPETYNPDPNPHRSGVERQTGRQGRRDKKFGNTAANAMEGENEGDSTGELSTYDGSGHLMNPGDIGHDIDMTV